MRKIFLAVATMLTIGISAQEKPLISEAVLAVDRRNDLPDAKKQIDEAGKIIDNKGGVGVDPKQMSKYLYYRGLIYFRISSSDKPEVKGLDANALDIATDSWLKLIDYEKQTAQSRYTPDAVYQLPYVAQNIAARGYDKNEAKDYAGSKDDFIKAFELKRNPVMGERMVTDTSLLYNASIIAGMAGDYKSAIDLSIQVLDMGYNGITYTATDAISGQPKPFLKKEDMMKQVKLGVVTDPVIGETIRPDIYLSLLANCKRLNDDNCFNTNLARARAEFPSNRDLINFELQGYLDAKQYDKALEIINVAIANDPENYIYYYVRGFIYQDNVKDDDKAIENYDKSISLNPGYFDTYFQAGLVYYNKGKAVTEEMNKLGISTADQKKYEKLKVEKENWFKKSLPYFEKAYEINDKETENIKALWEVYRQVGQPEKSIQMKKKLDELTAAQ